MIHIVGACEQKRIEHMIQASERICFIWLSSIILFYICTVVYYYKLSQSINCVWDFYFKKTLTTFPLIKGLLVNRLHSIHNYNYIEESDKILSKKSYQYKKFWIKYSLITISLVLIAVLIVILFIFIFSKNIYTSLDYKNNFIEIPLNRRIYASKIPFSIINKLNPKFNIESMCNNKSNFGSYSTELIEVENELSRLRSKFYKKDIFDNIPSDSFSDIFYSYSSNENFIKLGTSAALTYLMHESFVYWNNEDLFKLENLTKFLQDSYQMTLCYDRVVVQTEDSTNRIIENNFINLVAFVAASIFFIISTSFFVYFGYFKNEKLKIIYVKKMICYLLDCEEPFIKAFKDY